MKKTRGASGGAARAKKLSAKRRREIATLAAKVRWREERKNTELEKAWKKVRVFMDKAFKK